MLTRRGVLIEEMGQTYLADVGIDPHRRVQAEPVDVGQPAQLIVREFCGSKQP